MWPINSIPLDIWRYGICVEATKSIPSIQIKKPYANLCRAFEFLTIIVGILNGNNKKNPNCTVNSGGECASVSARAWAIAHWPNYELIARPPRMCNRKNIQFTMMYESALANGLEHYKFYPRKTTNNRTIEHKKMPMPMLFLAVYVLVYVMLKMIWNHSEDWIANF